MEDVGAPPAEHKVVRKRKTHTKSRNGCLRCKRYRYKVCLHDDDSFAWYLVDLFFYGGLQQLSRLPLFASPMLCL